MPSVNRFAWLAALACLAAFVGILLVLNQWPAFVTARPTLAQPENIAALGQALVSPDGFVIPFEVASILLIGALIGAIYVTGDQRK